MNSNADQVREQFQICIDEAGFNPEDIKTSMKPHEKLKPAEGKAVIYIFFNEDYIFNVYHAGPESTARIRSQQYLVDTITSATLAKSLYNDESMRSRYKLTKENTGDWIQENTSLSHFAMNGDELNFQTRAELKRLLKTRLKTYF